MFWDIARARPMAEAPHAAGAHPPARYRNIVCGRMRAKGTSQGPDAFRKRTGRPWPHWGRSREAPKMAPPGYAPNEANMERAAPQGSYPAIGR